MSKIAVEETVQFLRKIADELESGKIGVEVSVEYNPVTLSREYQEVRPNLHITCPVLRINN